MSEKPFTALDAFLSKDIFRRAVDCASECISITDEHNIVLYVNESFLKTYRCTAEDVLGKEIEFVRHPDYLVLSEEIMQETMKGGWTGELANRRKDGTYFPIILSTAKIEGTNGEFLGMIGLAKDISKEKEAEAIIKSTNLKLVRHVDVLRTLIRSDYSDFNEAAIALLKAGIEVLETDYLSLWIYEKTPHAIQCLAEYSRETQTLTSGQNLNFSQTPVYYNTLNNTGIVNAPDVQRDPQTRELVQGYLRPKGIQSLLDTVIIHKGEMVGLICCESKPRRNWAQEDVVFTQSLADQVSYLYEKRDRRHAENALKEMVDTKDRFFSIIAHDLKSPFNALLGFSSILNNEYQSFDDETRLSFIRNIYDSAKSTSRLLENLLDWSMVQLGSIQYRPENLDISTLINDVILLVKNVGSAKQVKIVTEVGYGIRVFTDANMTRTALQNLVTNAVNYSEAGDTVRITAKTRIDGFIEISVIDTGIGISLENQRRLFQVGERLAIEDESGKRGTGLGLILAREFVEKCKGTIGVESEPGKGSRFYFTLPVQ